MFRTTSRSFLAFASAAVVVCVAAPFSHSATVTGRVLDSTTSLPLAGVEVLVDGVPLGVTTNLMGQFTSDVGAGERLFTFRRAGFSAQSIGPVAIAAEGEASISDAKLTPEGAEEVVMLETLEVSAELVANSVVAVRQQADVSVDMLSASDFGKFTGTDVADIVVRVPGLSTTSRGSFAVVRGLAERYNPVMLDGIVLPSSDPERQSPELDIFPNRLVDAIVITKAYEPRLPGTSSGAAIELRTKPLPEGRKIEVQVGVRADEGYLKNESFLGANVGGPMDNFGLGGRERLEEAPGSEFVSGSDAERDAVLAYVKSPETANGLERKNFPLGGRFSFVFEDRINLDEESGRAFGYSVSYTQDRSASSETGERLSFTDATGGAFTEGTPQKVLGANYVEYEESELENRWGALGTFGYAFNRVNNINFSVFWSQVGTERYTRESNGLKAGGYPELTTAINELGDNPGQAPRPELSVAGLYGQDEIYYSQRHLFDLKLGGELLLDEPSETKATWTVARLQARQQEPEYLILPYQYSLTPLGLTSYTADFGGAGDPYTRYWRDTVENTLAGRADFESTTDFLRDDTKLRYGYYFDRTERNYDESSFSLQGGSVSGFSYDHFLYELVNTPPPPAGYGILSFGRPFAEAEREIDAVYLSSTFSLAKDRPKIKGLDFLVGLRVEDFSLQTSGNGKVGNVTSDAFYQALHIVETGSSAGYVVGRTEFDSELKETAYLPALALNYSPSDGYNVRLAYSQTTARPSFREIGSYFTIDRVANEFVHGNDQLTTSEVQNVDLRFEYFRPNSTDAAAISFFHKTIANPIERISIFQPNLDSISTWFNNENDAEVRGIELEGAKNLGFIGEALDSFTLGANYTFIDAVVQRDSRFESNQVDPTQDGGTISDERPLYDQPEWIANAYLTYANRPWDFNVTLSFFAISDTLLKVNEQVWDTYTEGHTRWDLTLAKRFGDHWRVNFSARNLFDPDRRLVADPESTRETIVYRRYNDGRSYTLSATYEF